MARAKENADDLIGSPGVGHNSISKIELEKILNEMENIAEEQARLGDDMKAVVEVAKQKGYDPQAIKAAFKLRMMDEEKRRKFNEREEMRDLYLSTLGLL